MNKSKINDKKTIKTMKIALIYLCKKTNITILLQ